MGKTHYELLGVAREASPEEIKHIAKMTRIADIGGENQAAFVVESEAVRPDAHRGFAHTRIPPRAKHANRVLAAGRGDDQLRVVADQHAASDPAVSAWVSANAGSGKTHVLAQRVIRLLLDGAPPSKILCLTYTKAAAANMAQRVFDTLARWTALDEEALERAIADTGALVRPHHLAVARKLFARAVETPGGLKIQTIHAFCERLLHQFPFEANLPSRFELLEDREKAEMLEAARIETLALALAEPDGEPLPRIC